MRRFEDGEVVCPSVHGIENSSNVLALRWKGLRDESFQRGPLSTAIAGGPINEPHVWDLQLYERRYHTHKQAHTRNSMYLKSLCRKGCTCPTRVAESGIHFIILPPVKRIRSV
jgi:hypothetical protein